MRCSLTMNPADSFRLSVLCLWLLLGYVNCENTQRGYVRAGQAPVGVHNDRRASKRWSNPPFIRTFKAGYNGNIYPAEYHTKDSQSPLIRSHPPIIPEIQKSKVPESQDGFLNPGLALVTQGQNTLVFKRFGNKAFTFADGKKVQQVNPESEFSAGVDQRPPHISPTRFKSTVSFPAVQMEKAPVAFGPNDRRVPVYSYSSNARPSIQPFESHLKSETQTIHVKSSGPNFSPKGFNHGRRTFFRPIDKGHFPGSNPAGKVEMRISSQSWSPRVYSSDGMSKTRGYTHVRHIKPSVERTWHQATAGRRTQDSWGPPPTERTHIPVYGGKFKPFQTRLTNDEPPASTNSLDITTAPIQTFPETTHPPNLTSTGNASTAVPPVTGEWSTKSASPVQTEGRDAELTTEASNPEGLSESEAEVGSSLEHNGSVTVSPPKLQPEDEGTRSPTTVSGLQNQI
ncbi:uncharacterized protein LOC134862851 [Eleginops maclovinus]|uniref:uncharacterized protein LOC134862851 n=1 Tax=Eleginops maclovinus TaxID=56733 RepID=UPI0030801CEC